MTFAHKKLAFSIAFALSLGSASAMAQKAAAVNLKETVKIAWIDPLSGLMAPVGSNQLKSFQFFAEKFSANNPAGVKFEVDRKSVV